MLTLHYLTDSRAHRILWMMEELGCDYDLKVYHRNPKTNLAPPELKQLHPLGKSPVVTDGEHTLAESGAIVDYLARTHGPTLLGDGSPQSNRDVTFWTHYSEGSLMAVLVPLHVINIAKTKVPKLLHPLLMLIPNGMVKGYFGPTAQTHLQFVDDHLRDREYLVGESLTIADIMMSFPLEASRNRAAGDYPAIRAYVQRLQARPAYQAALKRADVPYAHAG